MPTTNITVDDTNPLFDYQPHGAWNELQEQQAYGHSYHVTNVVGATAAFSFTGTSVSLFGAKRNNHDLYNVTLDGKTSKLNGSHPDPVLFQQVLFSASNLENTLHTVTLANAGTKPISSNSNFLSLDYIIFECTKPDNYPNISKTIQATDTSFVYEPKSAWSFLTINGVLEYGTNQTGASMTLDFYGQFVQIFGDTGSDYNTYSVSLDGNSPKIYNATAANSHSGVLLYYQDQLQPSRHNLKIVNQPVLSGSKLAINYAIVDSVAPHSTSKANSLSGGVIAGIAISSLAAIGVLIGVLIFIRKHSSSEVERMPQQFFSMLSRQPHESRRNLKSRPPNQPANHGYPLRAGQMDRSPPPEYTPMSNSYGLQPIR